MARTKRDPLAPPFLTYSAPKAESSEEELAEDRARWVEEQQRSYREHLAAYRDGKLKVWNRVVTVLFGIGITLVALAVIGFGIWGGHKWWVHSTQVYYQDYVKWVDNCRLAGGQPVGDYSDTGKQFCVFANGAQFVRARGTQ